MRTLITKAERQKCEQIIRYHTKHSIGGSLKTKFGPTVNLEEITKMTRTLAKMFKVSMTKTLATITAVNMLKEVERRREYIEKFPNRGETLPVSLTCTTVELAGWQMAEDFAHQRRQ